MRSILLVEDDARVAGLIRRYLEAEQYHIRWTANGGDALRLVLEIKPCLVILDVMLPGVDGLTLCDTIRSRMDVPIIMVTAMSEDVHRLEGFARGADDYLCKPFNPRELVARVKAVLRRFEGSRAASSQLAYDRIVLDLDERVLRVSDTEVDLTHTEFNMLRMFLLNPSRVLSREELLNGIHQQYSESVARSVDFHIKNLRRKLSSAGASDYIKSAYGVGFKFV